MKYTFIALLGILLTVSPKPSEANINQVDSASTNYVVIGAFSHKKNALMFTSHANQLVEAEHLIARYELHTHNNLFYVYVLSTKDHERAINEAKKLRHETEFADTWVYRGPLGIHEKHQKNGVDIDPISRKKIEHVKQSDAHPAIERISAEIHKNTNENKKADSVAHGIERTASTKNNNIPDDGTEGKKVVFNLYKAVDNSILEGEVKVIDAESAKKIGTYKANVPVKLSASNKSQKLSFVCEVFGYRKVQRELDYNAEMDVEYSINEDKAVVIPFELVRLRKGDIAVMYNVFFYKDAGVMRPESHFEINSLYEMLKENPNCRIKIHGHTNGSAMGRIITMGDNTKNFFSLSGTHEGIGSAKKLSDVRAKTIKKYLVNNGIDESRMEVKAWGGKRPLFDKFSSHAQENIRVEIEILQD